MVPTVVEAVATGACVQAAVVAGGGSAADVVERWRLGEGIDVPPRPGVDGSACRAAYAAAPTGHDRNPIRGDDGIVSERVFERASVDRSYRVTDEQRAAFVRDGYVHLPAVLAPDELAAIADVYDRFLRGDIAVAGKDFNDMTTGEHGTDPSRRTPSSTSCCRAGITRSGRPTCSSGAPPALPSSCAGRAW